MKTIKYLLIILFCSCATLLYSQVESTYYDAELSSDSIEMVANSLREQIDQWKQKVKENPKDEKAWMQYAGKLQSLKGISLLLSMKPSATLAVGADIRKISGITSKNGRNDAKRLNIRVVTVSNDDKPKNRKTQRKADLRRRMVCKSLPVKE